VSRRRTPLPVTLTEEIGLIRGIAEWRRVHEDRASYLSAMRLLRRLVRERREAARARRAAPPG
jgi:hypothetical protein